MRIDYGFGQLTNTAHKSKVPPGGLHLALNATTERGIAEARPGCGRMWPAAAMPANTSCIGAGGGDFAGVEEVVWILTDPAVNGGLGKLYSMNLATGVVTTHAGSKAWNDLNTGPWSFWQYDDKIYALNSTDGLWAKKIGDTTEAAWRRVNMRLVDITSVDSAARIDLPSPDYIVANTWNQGPWAGTPWAYTHADVDAKYPLAPTATVANSQLTAEWTNDPSNSIAIREFVAGFTFTNPIDMRKSRYWETVVEARPITAGEGEWAPKDDGEPRFDTAREFRVYVSEDPTAPQNDVTDSRWRTTRAYLREDATIPTDWGAGLVYRITITIDFDHVQSGSALPIVIDSVKKIAFRFPVEVGNDFRILVFSPRQGGAWMSKPYPSAYMDGNEDRRPFGWTKYLGDIKDLQYATTSIDSGTGDESTASFDIVSGEATIGDYSSDNLLPLGARVRISYPPPAGGYNRVRIYRFRHSTGEWVLLTEIASGTAGFYTDSLVDAAGDCNAWPTTLVLPATHDFGFAFRDIAGASCLTAWRGSLVIGAGKEVYISFVGDPTKYLKSVAQTGAGDIDTENPLIGRTLYVSNNLGDVVQGLVSGEALYAVTNKAVYAMIGDRPRDATPFFQLPGSYGSLGPQAMCAMNGGALVASRAGLFWYAATNFGAAGARMENLTESVQGSWAWLTSSTPENVAIIHHDGEILVANGRKAMKRNRSGTWEMLEYSADTLNGVGAAVNNAASFGAVTDFDPASVYGIAGYGPALPAGPEVPQTFALPELSRL